MYFDRVPAEALISAEQMDRVQLYMRTAEQLPNMKDKQIFLTMDMDYFSNTGYDTNQSIQVPFKGEADIKTLFKAFKKAQVAPTIVNFAISPEYSYIGSMNRKSYFSRLTRENVISTAVFLKNCCLNAISKRPSS